MSKPSTTSPPEFKAPPARRDARHHRIPAWVIILAVLAVALLAYIIVARNMRVSKAEKESQASAAQVTVEVVTAKRDTKPHDLTLPGNIQAYQDATLFARVNGYIKHWYKDIGTKVKAGDLIAEIEAPDLDAQLRQAQANLDIAALNFDREKDLLARKVISQQEFDTARTTLEAQKASVQNLQAQQGFEKITAPFNGTVTRRNIDVGDLVNAGNSNTGSLLFEVQQTDPLRVYVFVPQTNAPSINVGMQAKILVSEYPGRDFEGIVVRTAGALDPGSRTLLTEVDIPNPDAALYAGMYAQLKFVLEDKSAPVVVPANVFRFRTDGPQVATIINGNHVHWIDVKVGRDYGTKIELVSGVDDKTQLINNPTDDLIEGMAVTVKQADQPADKPGKSDASGAQGGKTASGDAKQDGQSSGKKDDGSGGGK